MHIYMDWLGENCIYVVGKSQHWFGVCGGGGFEESEDRFSKVS